MEAADLGFFLFSLGLFVVGLLVGLNIGEKLAERREEKADPADWWKHDDDATGSWYGTHDR